MHELSIAQSIVDIVLQHLPREEGVSVRSVRLTLGAMAGVVPDSLEFCFGAITEGTPLEPTLFACAACGSRSLTILSGREMQVRDIEVEENEGVR